MKTFHRREIANRTDALKMALRIIMALFFCSAGSPVDAQSPPVSVIRVDAESKEPYPVSGHAAMLKTDKGVPADEVVKRAADFRTFVNSELQADEKGKFDYWFLFEVKAGTSPLYLTLPIIQSFELELFKWDQKGLMLLSKGGILTDEKEKYLNHSTDVFDLNIDPDVSTKYLLKINRLPYKTFSARIFTSRALLIQNFQGSMLEGLLLGIILCVILYHLLIYLRVRETEYMLLAVYMFFLSIQIITITGSFGAVWYFKDTSWNHIFYNSVAPFSAFFSFWFSYVFLNISRKEHPWISKIFFAFMGIFVLSLIFALARVRSLEQLTTMISGLASVFLFIIGIIRLRHQFKPAIVYIIAYIPTFISIPYLLFYFFGYITYSWFTHNNLLISIALQAILFSLAIAAKINILKTENENLLQAENQRLESMVSSRTAELQKEKSKVENTLVELKNTQAQLIQSEKLASLGELTAGIAHEIQNPLNFVNNFSEVSVELIEELAAERKKDKGERDEELENDILSDISGNLQKINHHGKRASSIVKGMLEHSRASSGLKELIDINAMAEEYLRLAYHGLRANDKSFKAEFKMELDPGLPEVEVIQQDFGRVLLNLINNAFYATKRVEKPLVTVKTERKDNQVLIRISDNGSGIPEAVKDKIFQPFFTTKPTGEGTGLGLSLAYDIVKAHGGELKVETKETEGSEFIINFPVA
ncbi:7TM diverse intracellular signaling domain-containing protein [Emticicia sp. CRIBPO]|uniref:7TM diverse intracellular signaling domain-containing protein n=1 Tax=Emticicia sp. CRIBPO TaxID=2683258 RepID=UPI001E3D1017|nr:7TM diverse intracellular signaling domain-containing protein [Emticicia sp. CRIBPO]